jgi:hypothetical protein
MDTHNGKGALLQEPKDEFNSTDLLMSTEALDRFEKKIYITALHNGAIQKRSCLVKYWFLSLSSYVTL